MDEAGVDATEEEIKSAPMFNPTAAYPEEETRNNEELEIKITNRLIITEILRQEHHKSYNGITKSQNDKSQNGDDKSVSREWQASAEPLSNGYRNLFREYITEFHSIELNDNYFEEMSKLMERIATTHELFQEDKQKQDVAEPQNPPFHCQICNRYFENESKHYSEIENTYMSHLTSSDWETEHSMNPASDVFKKLFENESWNWSPLTDVKIDPFWVDDDWIHILECGEEAFKLYIMNKGNKRLNEIEH